MPLLTILHLSDLQSGQPDSSWWVEAYKSGVRTGTKLHDAILEALLHRSRTMERKLRIDAVLITGDIAEQGGAKRREYAEPVAFVKALLHEVEEKSGYRPELCAIPGNHDVNWIKSRRVDREDLRAHFDAKFADYNDHFAKEFRKTDLVTTFDKPFVSLDLTSGSLALRLIGLNSAEDEGHNPKDHRGFISDRQLDKLHEFLESRRSPSVLNVAAFHHNPRAHAPGLGSAVDRLFDDLHSSPKGSLKELKERIEQLLFCSKVTKATQHAARLRNYLHGGQRVLEHLARDGFLLTLHGHQHFDSAVCASFPVEPAHPFKRSSIWVLGAGSSGLRSDTTEQPFIPCGQLLTFAPCPWGWELTVERIEFHVRGTPRSIVSANLTSPFTLVLARGQPLEPIRSVALGLSRDLSKMLLGPHSSLPPHLKDDAMADVTDDGHPCRLWLASSLGAKVRRLADRDPIPTVGETEASDFRAVYLHGLKRWSEADGVYSDGLVLSVRGIEVVDNEPSVALRVEPFSRTVFTNWSLPYPILENGSVSFRKKWLWQRVTSNPIGFLNETAYLSARCEVTVVATVEQGDSRNLLIRVRSQDVTEDKGYAQCFVAGGCRPSDALAAPWTFVKDPSRELIDAARHEMQRETGYQVSDDALDFHLIGLYLDPHFLTPIWLFWLDLKKSNFDKYVRENPSGRDMWETRCLFQIPLFANDTSGDLALRIKGETTAPDVTGDSMMALRLWLSFAKSQALWSHTRRHS